MKAASGAHRLSRYTKFILHWLARFCLVAGTVALVWSAYIWTDAYFYQEVQSRDFHTIAENTSVRHEPVSRENEATSQYPNVEIGSVLGRLDIPRIGISVMVLEGDDPHILRRGAGHLEGSALPGQTGNVAIAAHRDTFFRSLRNIREQDLIELETLTGTYGYRVVSINIVGPEDTTVLAASAKPTLTLVTCYPFYYVGPAPKRFIVRARLISSLQKESDQESAKPVQDSKSIVEQVQAVAPVTNRLQISKSRNHE